MEEVRLNKGLRRSKNLDWPRKIWEHAEREAHAGALWGTRSGLAHHWVPFLQVHGWSVLGPHPCACVMHSDSDLFFTYHR